MNRRARLGLIAVLTIAASCGGGGDGGTTGPATPAAVSAVSSVPASAPVGTAVSTPLTVIVNDSKGHPVPSVVVTFRVTAGNGSVSSGAATTDATGKASTNFTLGSAAGANEVTASVTGVAATVKFSVTGIPASACTTPQTIGVGQVVTDLTTACVGGTSGQDYTAVVVGMSPTAAARTTIEIVGTSLGTPPAALSVSNVPTSSFGLLGIPAGPVRNDALEAKLIDAGARELTPMMSMARSWYAGRNRALRSMAPVPSTAKIGDTFQLNIGGFNSCSVTSAPPKGVIVRAVGQKSIILEDQSNPSSDFSGQDFQSVADQFDAYVDGVDRGAFGDPSDIDNNGKVLIVYTRAVNELTPANDNDSYVGGLTAPRDLFPITTSGNIQGCASSNVAEMFYMLAADSGGVVNGHKRSRTFINSVTVSTIAHEYQHLINFSRRLYVSNGAFDEIWLNEGLSHVAEELIFFNQSGFSPRSNIGATSITTQAQVSAFNTHFISDFGRYDEYLFATSTSSPYAQNDSLTTRGSTHFFLRYAADRTATTDGTIWQRLATGPATGRANLRTVFGVDDAGLQNLFRDFAIANWADDALSVDSKYTLPSWNIRSIYPRLTGSPPPQFPLLTSGIQRGLSDGAAVQTTINGGGFALYRFSTVSGANATIRITGVGGAALPPGALVQMALIRTR